MEDYSELRRECSAEVDKLESTSTAIKAFADDEYLTVFKPCPLLNSDGLCMCYQSRPIICRLYGQTSMFASCQMIFRKCKLPFQNRVWQRKARRHVIFVKFDADYLAENTNVFLFNSNLIVKRPYPLIYWLAKDADYLAAYTTALSKPKDEFIKFICTQKL